VSFMDRVLTALAIVALVLVILYLGRLLGL
jgi:hypothetical protein